MVTCVTLRLPEVPIGEVSVIPQACRVSIPMLHSHKSLQFLHTCQADSVVHGP